MYFKDSKYCELKLFNTGSVKHFKNSQQINYSTDHGSSYADRERNSPSFFLHISQMLNVSTLVIRQTSMR